MSVSRENEGSFEETGFVSEFGWGAYYGCLTLGYWGWSDADDFTWYDLNVKKDDSPPILLVHGQGGTQATMLPLAWELQQRGYNNIYTVNLSFSADGADVEPLSNRVEEIYAEHGIPVILVGHSYGGISALTVKAERGEHVGQVITIGSRIFEAAPTYSIFAGAANGVKPRIERLSGYLSTEPSDIASIEGEADWLVPSGAVRLPNYRITEGEGHIGVCCSTQTADHVVDVLAG